MAGGPIAMQTGVSYYASVADLPNVGQEVGNMVICLEPLGARMWDGSEWVAVGGGGGGATLDVQVFDTPGFHTWTKPEGAVSTTMQAIGGGGGGGSGRKGAAGSVRVGGGGGGSGGYVEMTHDAATLPDTLRISVAAGGTGGAAVTANDTNGNAGTGASATSVDDAGMPQAKFWLYAQGGYGGGGGGVGAGGAAGAAGTGAMFAGSAGGAASATGGNGGPSAVAAMAGRATGGAAGGGINATNVAANGGNGQGIPWRSNSNCDQGTVAAPDGMSPAPVAGLRFGYGGGSGGASSVTGNGGNGGGAVAGTPGVGGGGGGAAANDVGNSGAGGRGGDALVVITTWCES